MAQPDLQAPLKKNNGKPAIPAPIASVFFL